MPPSLKLQVCELYCYTCGERMYGESDGRMTQYGRYTWLTCIHCSHVFYGKDALCELVAACAEIDVDLSWMLRDV